MYRKLALSFLLIATASGAQTPDLSATIGRVVESVANLAQQNYVFADTGQMVAAYLRKQLASGAYRPVRELAQLADRLTVDMQKVNGDRHLYVTYTGRSSGTAPGTQPQMVMRRPGDPIAPEILAAARRANYDFNAVQRLAGNVGYVSIGLLSSRGSEEAYAVIDAAMAFLEHADALIIDLRRTPGGDPRMVDYMASYFYGAEPVPTLTSYSRRMDRTIEGTTLPVKGKRRPDVPIYMLVGPGTASGAEALAFIVKQTERGTLIGARTAGAGRLTNITPVGDGFSVSVSSGRSYDPRTGKEWERVGIEPDVAVSDDDALTTAHVAALQKLATTTADTAWAASLRWTREAVIARAKPVAVDAKTLRAYAGDYDVRLVRFENGRLWYQRDSARVREELTPLNDSTFALGEAMRVEFTRQAGRVTAMRLVTPTGQISTFPKTR